MNYISSPEDAMDSPDAPLGKAGAGMRGTGAVQARIKSP